MVLMAVLEKDIMICARKRVGETYASIQESQAGRVQSARCVRRIEHAPRAMQGSVCMEGGLAWERVAIGADFDRLSAQLATFLGTGAL